jgi:hypothetical protein
VAGSVAGGVRSDPLGVEILVATEAHDVLLESKQRLVPAAEVIDGLRRVLGEENVQFIGGPPELVKREPKAWERRGA